MNALPMSMLLEENTPADRTALAAVDLRAGRRVCWGIAMNELPMSMLPKKTLLRATLRWLLLAFGLAAAGSGWAQQSEPAYAIARDWPRLSEHWLLGDPTSVAVDENDNVWVLHRPRTLLSEADFARAAPPIVVFDQQGNVVQAWGGAGDGYQWPQREHFIHLDGQGGVWLGGNYCVDRNLPRLERLDDDQILKFSRDGEFLLQLGRASSSGGSGDTANFSQPADAYVHGPSNELFVADGYGNHRVIVLDAVSGAFKRQWGAFSNAPVDRYACPPPALASVPAGAGPDQFSIVHAIRVSNDGIVYVADRENRRVQAFTLAGEFIGQVIRHDAPFARNLALSSDPAQRFLIVGGGSDIVMVERDSLEILASIELPGMIGGGHQIAVDSRDNIYIAGSARGLQKLIRLDQ